MKFLRPLWILRYSCFAQLCGIGIFGAFEVVLMRERGVSHSHIGLLLAGQNGMLIILAPFWGRLADRTLRYREIVVLGSVGMMAAIWVFAHAESLGGFVLYAFLRGFSLPALNGVMPVLAVANLGDQPAGRGFGGYRAFGSFGFVVTTIGLPWLFADIPTIAMAASAIFATSLVAVISLQNPTIARHPEAGSFRGLPGRLYLFFAALYFISFAEPAVHGFLGDYARSLGASVRWIGFLAGMNGIMAMGALAVMGHWIDLKGPRLILLLAFCAQTSRLVVIGFIDDASWLWLPQLFHFVGWAGKEVATILFVTHLAGLHQKATAMTLAVSAKVAGILTSSLLIGRLLEDYAYPQVYWIVAGITLIGTVLLFLLPREHSEGGAGPRAGKH